MQSNIYSYIPKDIHSNTLIRVNYSPYALQQTRNIIKHGIYDEAVSRKYEEGISIDGIESKDLDDAIWAEKFANGYRVFVHISDVTEAIKIYSPLDLEALKRTTSIYRRDKVLNMFPNELSQDILSLDENGEKLTMTMTIDLDFDGNIADFDVYESRFKNLRRYDYDSFLDDFNNPDAKFHQNLQLMYEIARIRRNNRSTSGADLTYDESDRRSYVGAKDGKKIEVNKGVSKILIEEFMILANICAAKLIYKNQIDGVFRVHQKEDERAFYNLKRDKHVGLALDDYTHFTSPIRRYSDDIVHRVLKLVYLRGLENPYTKGQINDISKHINISREILDIVGGELDRETSGLEKINKLKNSGEKITTSSFTRNIRSVENGHHKKRLPSCLKEEIIQDIKHGKIGDWAWCIGVFLLSKEDDIKAVLYNRLLKDFVISPKSVLNILNETKIFDEGENRNLFHIEHIEDIHQYSIIFNFRGEQIFKVSDNINNKNLEKKKGDLRKKALKKIFSHFLNFKEHNIK